MDERILQNTLSKVKQVAQRFTQPARDLAQSGGLVNKIAPQATARANNFLSQNFSMTQGRLNPVAQVRAVTQMAQPMAQQYRQQVDQLVPRLSVPKFNIQNPVKNFAANLPGYVVEGAVNALPNAVAGLAKAPAARNIQQGLADAADVVLGPTTFGLPSIGKNVVKSAVQQGAGQALKKGLIGGAKVGAVYGGLGGLSQNSDKPLGTQLLEAGKGAAVGGATGGILGFGGTAAGLTVKAVQDVIKRANPNIPQAQISKIARQFIRDEAGRFAKGAKKPEPVFYGDIRESLGLPRNGEYQGGFIKLGSNPQRLKVSSKSKDTGITAPQSSKVDSNPMLNSSPEAMLPQGSSRLRVKPTGQQSSMPSGMDDTLQSGYKEIGSLANAPKKSLSQRFDEFYTNWVDRYNPIVKTAEAVEKQGKAKGFMLRPEANPKYTLKRFLGMGGIAENRYNQELKPVLNLIDDLKIPQQDIDLYLKSRRDINLSQRGVKGSDAQTAAQRAGLLEQKYGEDLKVIAHQLYEYQDKGFKELAQAGFINPNSVEAIQQANANYVPFQRVMDQLDEYLGIPSKTAQQAANPVKGIKGSDKQIYSPIESIVAATFKQRAAIEKNNVAKSIVGLQQSLPELGFKKVGNEGYDTIQTADGFRKVLKPASQLPKDTIVVWNNGQKEAWKVGEEIGEAVKGLNEETMNNFLKVLTVPASILRQGATGRNPEFMFPNMIRDQFDAALNSQYGYTPFVDWAKGLAHMMKKDDVYEAWVNSGGAQTFSSMSGRKSIQEALNEKTVKQRIIPKIFGWLGKGLDAFGSVSEQPTRVGLFANAYKKTGNPMFGAMEAREGTLDFARMGAKMRVANSIVPFLNVSVQGFDRMIRSAKANPAKFGLNMSLYGALPAVATTLYNITYHPEEYAEIPQFVKEDNFVIVTGRNDQGTVDYISIPKGNVIRYIANPTQNFLEFLSGTNQQSFQEAATLFLSSGLPLTGEGSSLKEVGIRTIGANLPQAIKPITENLINKSFYKYNTQKEEAKEIVPYYLKDKPAGERAYEFTPGAYQFIGRALNISPLQIQNLMEGYLAGYVKIPVNIIENLKNLSENKEIDKNKVPLLRRFIQQTYPTQGLPKESIVNTTDARFINNERASLIESASAAEKNVPSVDQLINTVKEDNQISALEKEKLKQAVSQITKQKTAILGNSKLNDEQKNIELEKLEGFRKQLLEADNKPKEEKIDYLSLPLTGNSVLDKEITSKQATQITSKITQTTKDYVEGKITAEQANDIIAQLKEQQKKVKSSTKVKKPKKLKIKAPKLTKVKVKKAQKIKTKRIKLAQIKLDSPKGSENAQKLKIKRIT